MNNSEDKINYKSLILNYIILITLCLFVVIYIIINFDKMKSGLYFKGDMAKTFLITTIILLLLYFYASWDDNDLGDSNQSNQSIHTDIDSIPKFKLDNINNIPINNNPINNNLINNNPINNNIITNELINGNLKDLNPTNNIRGGTIPKYTFANDINNDIINSDIFISQKNINKFVLQF